MGKKDVFEFIVMSSYDDAKTRVRVGSAYSNSLK